MAANAIANPDKLSIGQGLVIPDAAVPISAVASPTPPAPPDPAAPASPPAGDRTRQLSEQRLATVHPILTARGRSLIDLSTHAGATILITQGLRTWEEQDALYAKGRTTPAIGEPYIVTMAKGGQSYHNFGLACAPCGWAST